MQNNEPSSVSIIDDDLTNKINNKHLTWYEYEIERFEMEKLKTLEYEKQFIINREGCKIAPDGQIPNSIIRKNN